MSYSPHSWNAENSESMFKGAKGTRIGLCREHTVLELLPVALTH